MGSASQFIEAPDVSKGHLTLSGIVVRASKPACASGGARSEDAKLGTARRSRSKEQTETEVMGSPAMRMFHPGKRLDYALEVY